MYVGTGFNPADTTQLWVARVNKEQTPFTFAQDTADTLSQCGSQKPGSDFAWCYDYDSTTGVLTVSMNMNFSEFKQNYAEAVAEHCQPSSYCSWNGSNKSCGCALPSGDPRYGECQNACSNWAGKSIDCPWDSTDFGSPTGACYGFGVKLPSTFEANDQAAPTGTCLSDNPPWNVAFTAAASGVAGNCAYTTLPAGSYCGGTQKAKKQ